MGTAMDPGGLEAGTREVYYWVVYRHATKASEADLRDALDRGVEPTQYRRLLLEAWSVANVHEHARLRVVYPEYAGAMLMWQSGGLVKVRELLDAVEADLVDIREARTARRATFQPVRRG